MRSRNGGSDTGCGSGAWAAVGQPIFRLSCCHFYGCDHGTRIGLSLSSNVKGSAVVGRGADDGETKRHINALIKMQRLERDQRLVVIHAERDVISTPYALMEHGIGGKRAGDVRSEEHTSELQSLMRISYAVFCLNK